MLPAACTTRCSAPLALTLYAALHLAALFAQRSDEAHCRRLLWPTDREMRRLMRSQVLLAPLAAAAAFFVLGAVPEKLAGCLAAAAP